MKKEAPVFTEEQEARIRAIFGEELSKVEVVLEEPSKRSTSEAERERALQDLRERRRKHLAKRAWEIRQDIIEDQPQSSLAELMDRQKEQEARIRAIIREEVGEDIRSRQARIEERQAMRDAISDICKKAYEDL